MNNKNCGIVSKNKSGLIFLSLIVFAQLFVSGCWNNKTKDTELMVINVLDKQNFDDCHIAGSVNIPFEDLEKQLPSLNKEKHYVLYCSNYACMAAPAIAQSMQSLGFKHVSVYPGGIVEWYQKKYPCQGPAKLEYLDEENEPLGDDDHGKVSLLTAEELKDKMQKFGLLS